MWPQAGHRRVREEVIQISDGSMHSPRESRMFKGGEKISGDMGEDGVSVAPSQSLATRDFTCEINPDFIPCNKTEKIRTNVTLRPRYLTEETGKLTSI